MQPPLYQVNEIFYSLQGEGKRAGDPSVFVRFSGCNQTCRLETHDFDCDTEFVSGRRMSAQDILIETQTIAPVCRWIVLTGGEPMLQVDDDLIGALHEAGYQLAIETNGSLPVPASLDWITVSPKVAEHALRQLTATEVKYVRGYGQGIPKSSVTAQYYLISPAFAGERLDSRTLAWCIALTKDNPQWSLSVQQHKFMTIR